MTSKSVRGSFGAVKSVCKFLGVYFDEESFSLNYLNIFINIVLVVLQLALVLPSLAYFIQKSSNVNDAAEVLSILFPSTLHLGQYCILVFTKTHLNHIFNNFEELIDRST